MRTVSFRECISNAFFDSFGGSVFLKNDPNLS